MINVVCGIRSTGKICTDLATKLEKEGHEIKILYGRENVPSQYEKYAVKIGNKLDVISHALYARLFDGAGWGSKVATRKIVEWIENYDPNIIHLHNLHGYYINIEILFDYLKKSGKKVVWTLHDCWAFTGHCAHFDYEKCEQWKTGCRVCLNKTSYPICYGICKAGRNYSKKKEMLTNVPDLRIVTPSYWLKQLVEQSFLQDYPVEVIHNGIDVEKFTCVEENLREKYNLQEKKIVLSVAAFWNKRKGFDTLIRLAKDTEYQVVIIGVTKRQRKHLPKNVIAILRTDSVDELVQWYSVADVVVNPTLEDNYPTVNLEAQACGTPVITYNTGGSSESVPKQNVVKQGDLESIIEKIECGNLQINSDASLLDKNELFKKYIELYNN